MSTKGQWIGRGALIRGVVALAAIGFQFRGQLEPALLQQRLDDHLPALEQRLSALNLRKVQLKVRRLDTYEAL